jgi:hypothetical protein
LESTITLGARNLEHSGSQVYLVFCITGEELGIYWKPEKNIEG